MCFVFFFLITEMSKITQRGVQRGKQDNSRPSPKHSNTQSRKRLRGNRKKENRERVWKRQQVSAGSVVFKKWSKTRVQLPSGTTPGRWPMILTKAVSAEQQNQKMKQLQEWIKGDKVKQGMQKFCWKKEKRQGIVAREDVGPREGFPPLTLRWRLMCHKT